MRTGSTACSLLAFSCCKKLFALAPDSALRATLFYFTNKRMKGNIYLPEDLCVYRGKRFFDEFASIDYALMDEYMRNMRKPRHNKGV